MTKNVLQICQSCAENNDASWKNPRNTAPIYLGVCGCCKEVKPCVHIGFWLGIKSNSDLKSPQDIKKEKKKNANKTTDVKPEASKGKTTSDLLGNAEEK